MTETKEKTFKEWVTKYEESEGKWGWFAREIKLKYPDFPDTKIYWHCQSYIIRNWKHNNWRDLTTNEARKILMQMWSMYDGRMINIADNGVFIGDSIVANIPDDIDIGNLKLPRDAVLYLSDIVDNMVEFIYTGINETYSFFVPIEDCVRIELVKINSDLSAINDNWDEINTNNE